MPGLMNRASTVVKAKISKLLDRAEDPGETLDYSYEKQLELLQNVKRGVADVTTSKKRLELQTQQLEQSVVKLETQARQALAAGGDRLPRLRVELDDALLELLRLHLEALLRGHDVRDAALHVLEQLNLLFVRVVEGLARILGAVEQLRELRLDDRRGA